MSARVLMREKIGSFNNNNQQVAVTGFPTNSTFSLPASRFFAESDVEGEPIEAEGDGAKASRKP